MTIDATTFDRLRNVYRLWEESGGSCIDPWLALISDDFRLNSLLDGSSALRFSREARGKAEVVAFFQGLIGDWELMDSGIKDMFGCDDRVVVLSQQAYRNRRTDKVADGPIAHIWHTQGDEAIELQTFLDTAKWIGAAL